MTCQIIFIAINYSFLKNAVFSLDDGTVYIYHVIKNLTSLPVLALVFFPITAYQCHFIVHVLVDKLSMFLH